MKITDRLKLASKAMFSKQFGKTYDASRIITEALDLNFGSIGLFGGLQSLTGGEQDKKYYLEQISPKDVESTDIRKLLPKVIKSDPALDQASDFFTTLTTQAHTITAEDDRTEREINEITEFLEAEGNPLDLNVMHAASSLIMRGDICVETEFDDNGEIVNLWVNDPIWVEWRMVADPQKNTTRWALGHYSKAIWEEIKMPYRANVYYLAGNPLIGERTSRSPLQTAVFPALSQTQMIKSLQSILDIHAWAQTLFSVQKLELMKIQAMEGSEIDDVDGEVMTAMELINTVLAQKKPHQVMGMTDDIKPVELGGGGEKLTWTTDMGNLYDKRVSMGSKTPSTVGGQQQRADYSTRQQNLFYSVYLQSGQENLAKTFVWSYTRMLRSRGNTGTPIYSSKSVNVEARRIEAEAFQEIMKGIGEAVNAGIPLPCAIELFEEQAGQTFPADLKSKIEKHFNEYGPVNMQQNNNSNRNNRSNNNNNTEESSLNKGDHEVDIEDDLKGDERLLRDKNFIVNAGSQYLKKKIIQKAFDNIEEETIKKVEEKT